VKFTSKLTKDFVVCNELKVKHYKEILKSTFGDDVEFNVFVETIYEILKDTTNLSSELLKNLSVVDIFLLLLDLKINSHGNVCKVIVTKDDKKMNLELRLDYIREELFQLAKTQLSVAVVEDQGFKIELECPSLDRLLEETESESSQFIKKLIHNSSDKKINIDTNKNANLLFDKLPLSVFLKINKKFNDLVHVFAEHNFLSRYHITEQQLLFLPSIESLVWFIKLLFSEPLDVFYDNVFYLSYLGHMSITDVDNLTPGEYTYFVRKLEQTINNQKSTPDQQSVDSEMNSSDTELFE
jgi:hypothetical protein